MRQARSHEIVGVAILAATAATGFGQDANLMRADTAFAEAVIKADNAALEQLLDAEFTWANGVGKVQTKAQVLREMPKIAITNAKDADRRRMNMATFPMSR